MYLLGPDLLKAHEIYCLRYVPRGQCYYLILKALPTLNGTGGGGRYRRSIADPSGYTFPICSSICAMYLDDTSWPIMPYVFPRMNSVTWRDELPCVARDFRLVRKSKSRERRQERAIRTNQHAQRAS